MKAKYHKGGDLPTGTVPAYTYCHSSDNKDRIREETAALFDLMFRCSDCFSLTVTECISQVLNVQNTQIFITLVMNMG